MPLLTEADKFSVWAEYMRYLSREGIVIGPIDKFTLRTQTDAACDAKNDAAIMFTLAAPLDGALRAARKATNDIKLVQSVAVLRQLIAAKRGPAEGKVDNGIG